MDERQYVIAVAAMGDMLLKNAAKAYGIDFGLVNDLLIENRRRAYAIGVTKEELEDWRNNEW